MKLKRIIAIACTAAMTVSLISGCGKIPGDGYGTSGRKNESECKDSERNVI